MSSASASASASNSSTTNNAFLYGTTVSFGILIALIVLIIYKNRYTIPSFDLVLWGVFPLVVYIISACLNLLGQWMSCGTASPGKGFLSAVPTVISTYFFLALAQIAFLRVPVASLFSDYFAQRECAMAPNSHKKPLNPMNYTIEELEIRCPTLRGISTAYYLFWGTMFGQIITSGLSSACPR